MNTKARITTINLGLDGYAALKFLRAKHCTMKLSEEVRRWILDRAKKEGFELPSELQARTLDRSKPPHDKCPICLKGAIVVAVKKYDSWKCPDCGYHALREVWTHLTPELVEQIRLTYDITPAKEVDHG